MASLIVATDIGGTFTDLVAHDSGTGKLIVAKSLSTPPNFENGVLNAIKEAGFDNRSVETMIHGTTVVINALTERKGAKTALITTRGFRDVLELGRSNRPALYNMRFRKPTPFVDRYLRYEVEERIDATGEVLVGLNREDVRTAAEQAKAEGATAVAVCFLHSYVNPEHEVICGELIAEVFPEASVTCSHEVSREWREYERTSTAVLNAYVQPVVSDYIQRLAGGLEDADVNGERFIMRSNGGTSSFERARMAPITMIESGPVGGVIGAAVVGNAIGMNKVISFDIGGTTAKSSLILDGEVESTTEYRVDWRPDFPGYPVKTPVVDIIEIGAGGGSIAWVDEAGALTVGPRSAGASPGPACYDLGGTEPTVTDANLVCGRINADYFLGGDVKLSIAAAETAIGKVAEQLGIGAKECARGILRLANASMSNAIRLVSVQRGFDPRDFALVAFGGGGSMHAAMLADEMNIGRIVVPNVPGHFNAWGMLTTDLREEWTQTRIISLGEEGDTGVLEAVWADMRERAEAYAEAEQVEFSSLSLFGACGMRYAGQEHQVRVELGTEYGTLSTEELEQRFRQAHLRLYGFEIDGPVECVTFQLAAARPVEKAALSPWESVGKSIEGARKGERIVDFDQFGEVNTQIFERDLLPEGEICEGPAIIEERAASTLVLPGHRLVVDKWGHLILDAPNSELAGDSK